MLHTNELHLNERVPKQKGQIRDGLLYVWRDSGASVICLVAKSHDAHVERALRTTLDENLAMIADTIRHLREQGMRVFLDANVLFSAAKSDGAIKELLKRLEQSGHQCCVDAYVIEEARRNLGAKAPDRVAILAGTMQRE